MLPHLPQFHWPRPLPRRSARLGAATCAAAALAFAACAAPAGSPAGIAPSGATVSAAPPSPDPRVGLRPGRTNAGEAAWNMRLVTNVPTPAGGRGAWNSDLAFLRNYVIQGNYNGFIVWDVSNPARPREAGQVYMVTGRGRAGVLTSHTMNPL